jgi:hypothetical protein
VAKKNKSSKLWKPYEDRNILLVFVALIASLANLVYTIVQFTKNTSTWDNIIRDCVILVLYLGVFTLFLRQNHKLAVRMATKPIPVYFVTDRKAEEVQQDFEKLKSATGFKDWDKIEGFSTRSSCLIPWEKNRLPPDMGEWKRYIAEGFQGISNFVFGVEGNKIYHIAVKGPTSLVIALGAAFGTMHPLIYYHYEKENYEPKLDLTGDPRLVKESLPADHQYRYFEVVSPEKYTKDIAVILGGASHEEKAFVDARRYLKEKEKDWSVVEVHSKFSGNLKEKDWVPAVREQFFVFQNLFKQEVPKSFHVFYSMPLPLGFGLGMALGHVPDMTLYNFEDKQNTYYPVLKLNELGVTY